MIYKITKNFLLKYVFTKFIDFFICLLYNINIKVVFGNKYCHGTPVPKKAGNRFFFNLQI